MAQRRASGGRGMRALYVAEPAPAFKVRAPIVVDTSAVVATLFEETEAARAAEILRAHELHAPVLLTFEFANVARSKSRAGAPAERVAQALQVFAELRVELHLADAAELHALSLAHGLTACDAAYLALAARLRCPLFTFDQHLAAAAQRHFGALG